MKMWWNNGLAKFELPKYNLSYKVKNIAKSTTSWIWKRLPMNVGKNLQKNTWKKDENMLN